MECNYFLSYVVVNKEVIILELSAKTDGWVAVGFSSDAKLGGGDDVIACKRKHTTTNEIIAQPLWISVTHFRPQLKESKLNLTSAQYADGYIYCRVTRPLNVKMDKNLDLTNDWYQLYITGPIEASGRMLKPVDGPQTSPDKLTVLMHENRLSAVSGGSCLAVHVLVVLIGVISPYVS
ncbi:DOMON domain-containing protein FRRS1L-like [Gigantopelta aegis]|uniref:DOMON domain-containing protein FRRS1L-like n=1 Tax=Gigantopelta aegis TaxID=1735272 RepID=UPI001B88B7D2|nr:DOMON domain-containing protein FRRS1L-like [Gigantopelta aegis]